MALEIPCDRLDWFLRNLIGQAGKEVARRRRIDMATGFPPPHLTCTPRSACEFVFRSSPPRSSMLSTTEML